jgi:hypothetical protein
MTMRKPTAKMVRINSILSVVWEIILTFLFAWTFAMGLIAALTGL